jgi:putative ABC transport system permease protein
MGVADRALRNTLRKAVRSVFVILILGFALCVFITMSIVNDDISGRVTSISQTTDNGITVRPAGTYGGFGGDQTMSDSVIPQIRAATDVSSVQEIVMHFEGSFGAPGSGTPPVIIQGEDPSQPLIMMSGGTLTITSGRSLDSGDAGANVAIVGSDYASTNSVSVPGTITLNGTTVSVVGEFTTGYKFGDNSVILPIKAAQSIYSISGISMAYVTVNDAGNVNTVVSELQSALGSAYDIVSNAQMAANIQDSINSITSDTQTALVISLLTGVAVMVFLMILITRERTREIGVMKAIGFSNSSIIMQFFTESIVLALFGFAVSLGLAIEIGPTLSNMLLGGSSGGPGPSRFGGGFFYRVSFTLQPDLVIYALIIAVVIGIVGSLYPILRAVTLKPAEALRYE